MQSASLASSPCISMGMNRELRKYLDLVDGIDSTLLLDSGSLNASPAFSHLPVLTCPEHRNLDYFPASRTGPTSRMNQELA